MKFSILAAAAAAVPAMAAPSNLNVKRQNIDVTVLQFALTLEHLEDAFYSQGLRRNPELTRSAFFDAGFNQTYYDNLKRITDDEKSHVALLQAAIKATGATPVVPCKYKFDALNAFANVQNFISTSSLLEGVGTSAYLGGAPLITSKDYLTVAGSILVTESLHTSYQRNANKLVPFATPYGTPLDPTSVFTLASVFIESCPNRNDGKVPFVAQPALTVTSAPTPIVAGSTVTFNSAANVPAGSYLTFISGLSIVSVQATGSGTTVSAAVPTGQAGQVYVLATEGAATENKFSTAGRVISGPAVVEVRPEAPKFL